MLLKVAICEDDPTQAKNVRRMVEAWGEARGQKTTVYPYAGCEAFLMDWMERYTDKRLQELKQATIQLEWKRVYMQKAVQEMKRQQSMTKAQ